VSTEAVACPHCGAPEPAKRASPKPPITVREPEIPAWKRPVPLIALTVVLVVVITSIARYTEEKAAKSARDPGRPASDSALPGDITKALSEPLDKHGTLKLERAWETGEGTRFATGYALVSYENTTNRTFQQAVTIRCDALDTGGGKIGTNTRSFFVFKHGPIQPGFRGTEEIPINTDGTDFTKMSCWIESAR